MCLSFFKNCFPPPPNSTVIILHHNSLYQDAKKLGGGRGYAGHTPELELQKAKTYINTLTPAEAKEARDEVAKICQKENFPFSANIQNYLSKQSNRP